MTWPDLPPMNTLVPFEAVIRLGSMSRAADELHVTHGAVSRQVAALERSLGVSLFDRQGRRLEPTDEAVALSASISQALEQLSAASRVARPADRSAALVLSCEPTLLMRWLIARLPTLDPNINLRLSAAGGPIDLDRRGVDAAIRRQDFPLPDRVASTTLFAEWIGPVCSPAVAGQLAEVGRWNVAPRLHSATRADAWQTWSRLAAEPIGRARSRTFEHFYLSLEAAAAGLGVAIGPYALVHQDIATGRLVAPRGFTADGTDYVLIAARRSRAPLDVLHRWLCEQARESVPPPGLRAVGG